MCTCNGTDPNRSRMRVGQEKSLCTVRSFTASCTYPQPNTSAPLKPLFCLFPPKQLPVKTLVGLKVATPSRDVCATVSDLNYYVCRNALPKVFSKSSLQPFCPS